MRREFFTGSDSVCPVCSNNKLGHRDNPITNDHIVARIGIKDHKTVLGELITFKANLSPMCRDDHTFVDFYKIRQYTEGGLAAMLGFIAKGYPRFSSPDLWEAQTKQFIALFSKVNRLCYENLTGLSDEAVGYYNSLGNRADRYVRRWQQNGLPPVSIDMYRRVW